MNIAAPTRAALPIVKGLSAIHPLPAASVETGTLSPELLGQTSITAALGTGGGDESLLLAEKSSTHRGQRRDPRRRSTLVADDPDGGGDQVTDVLRSKSSGCLDP